MKTLKELMEDQVRLIEELDHLNNKVVKHQQAVDTVNVRIEELKEQQTMGTFKFLLEKMSTIMNSMAPKHKINSPRNLSVSSDTDSSVSIIIPWGKEKCTDSNPCNINLCDRCTFLNAKNILTKLLAGYYSK
jgi:hypothetical protein